MRASLPMYNLPEMRPANAAFWQAMRLELARRGVTGTPEALEYDRAPVPARIEAETLFTQVCGWPLQTIYAGQARLLGMPCYDAPGCEGAGHAGVFIVHRDSRFQSVEELRGCHFVFNSRHSNSGMNLPRRVLAEMAGGRPFFGNCVETHSQPGNIERVARGEAEASCVDCVTYAFFRRYRPLVAAEIRTLGFTVPSPSIPFVTSVATPAPVVAALEDALQALAKAPAWAAARAGLMLRDVLEPDEGRYIVQRTYEAEAAALGYPRLA
ncbi:phosphate/phosphite/phosphonate ABC transporter substrate-binding protein [Siccirubricoccus phaeus]|uniref:phosphate/phosphite/phosphonate ABC transporter substrate-binding protein n=1 Tax=Siccirubricoccus phaeus TaxID=2595053 RepID=UPI0011F2B118|nr:PhnD/SsuA/transferrin family substrate-binding protein [Siccirubricoccus phaeus]